MNIKNQINCICIVLSIGLAASCSSSGIPAEVDTILKNIKVPEFRQVDYLVTDFGAVADSVTDCRAAINNAITKCSDDGGGRVVLPQGKVFCKGCINIKSNVNLHIPEGCELIFSADPMDYLPAELTVWEGTELYNYASSQLRRDVLDIKDLKVDMLLTGTVRNVVDFGVGSNAKNLTRS